MAITGIGFDDIILLVADAKFEFTLTIGLSGKNNATCIIEKLDFCSMWPGTAPEIGIAVDDVAVSHRKNMQAMCLGIDGYEQRADQNRKYV